MQRVRKAWDDLYTRNSLHPKNRFMRDEAGRRLYLHNDGTAYHFESEEAETAFKRRGEEHANEQRSLRVRRWGRAGGHEA